MRLIADSGSTKTTWNLSFRDKNINSFTTRGINPFFQSLENIEEHLIKDVLPHITNNTIDCCYLYGAGCADKSINEEFSKLLTKTFNCKQTTISSDILGAARAIFQQEKGIAAILGTGSNCCYYDGENITQSVYSGGFILGDEGSGGALGKRLIADFIKKQMPYELYNKLKIEHQLDYQSIINCIYKKPFPNRYLANFSHFLLQNKENDYIQQLLRLEFTSFLKRNIMQFKNWHDLQIGFSGSIAYYFKDELYSVLNTYNLKPKAIIKNPIEELVKYHNSKK